MSEPDHYVHAQSVFYLPIFAWEALGHSRGGVEAGGAAASGLCSTSEIHRCELSSAISSRHLTRLPLHLSYSGLIGNMSFPPIFTLVTGS